MSQASNQFDVLVVKNQAQATQLVEKLFAVAKPDTVYSEPVTVNDYTVITASEVSVSMGFGYGAGGGSSPVPTKPDQTPDLSNSGGGGGGGGGGLSVGRPVAVISIGPSGVQVEPIVDVTKIALAFFTTMGGMLLMLNKMRQVSQD